MKLKATIRMALPSKEQDAFMLALQTKYDDVEKTLASIDVHNANATVESDKWMIFAEIERSLGSRMKIEELCKNMGLEVEATSPRKVGETESDWLNRQSEKFFLRCSARGSADEGGVVQWDHIDRTWLVFEREARGYLFFLISLDYHSNTNTRTHTGTITRIDDGEILYELHDGLNRMNIMLSEQMCKALSDITLESAMRSVKPIRKTKRSTRKKTFDSTKESED